MRHTTFRLALDPTPAQAAMLARHAGASRFAYNQCLRLLTDAIRAKATDPSVVVPWSGFDLINAFNAWKRSEAAGCIFVVSSDGCTIKQATGLAWRQEVSAQVFAEAAVDLGRALAAYEQARSGKRRSGSVGFPRRKRKGRCRDSFRLRNKWGRNSTAAIRVGEGHPRSVILPTIGAIRVHDDTRRLRRLLRPITPSDQDAGIPMSAQRAKILFATCSRHGPRWYVSLNIEAPDFHPQRRHPSRAPEDHGGFVGVDRGLNVFAVAATATGGEVGRFTAPKPLQQNMVRLRQRSRAASRTQPRSSNHAKAMRRLSGQHARVANVRRCFLHEVSRQLVKTHDRLCLEDLAVANLLRNRRLARAINDAGWAEFARQLAYKAIWFDVELIACDRWFPSTTTCSRCGQVKDRMSLAERRFSCGNCGLVLDRDRNAATNLAAWAEAACVAVARAPDRQAGGRVTNASGGEGAHHHCDDGATGPSEGGTDAHATAAWQRTPEKGAAGRPRDEESDRL